MINLQTIKQRFSIIGRSEALDRALSTAVRVSDTDLSVLITGESGVGKEVFSKIIHGLSIRKHNQFIAINCGAIPEGTINSELFGHEKGAFTGATSDRKGYFETVDGGTIFLDEIGEMPLDTQSFLLRILESGEFIRVGSSKVLKTNVRVVAATNVNLQEKIKAGKFREDLYYRLNTVPIYVPPLRERREDIYMLFRKFCVDFAEKYRTTPIQLEDKARQIIENYSWPGNIRQLRNIAEQLSVLSEDKLITAEHLILLIPNITERHLPMIPNKESNGNTMQEREILYKLLFDMKSDLNDLKSLVYELIRRNNLNVPDWRSLQQLQSVIPAPSNNSTALGAMTNYPATNGDIKENVHKEDFFIHEDNGKPVIIDDIADSYNELEVVDENLSIMEHEKSLIQKALRKYSGRRKDAAQELGISERTLYRKIKEYDL
jgi:DNA-binding NtrC family response regulator